ncbi:peptidase inhibitor family I36 protein [Streptomyces sp. BV286]|uniref:peptidase inhibitor family I36 protein n=1 Tax=unclassified Streptomyces TaxID=2593676 RepID=UPI001C2EF86A|nr:peptidase inhibitor family I36 protein [Streptomyces sp. BV286]MBV1935005.1 peptidase inhibitor family I36 protein [Streptomyces sp. BV286]
MGRSIRLSVAPLAAGVALVASTLAIGAPTAGAEEVKPLPPVAASDSRAEIESLTLNDQQALQAEVDAKLAETNNGGKQISANEISWNGGEVILTLPLPGEEKTPLPSEASLALNGVDAAEMDEVTAAAADWEGCPAGANDNRWYCFYQLPDFEGQRVQWNWAHCSTGINFSDVGFNNKTTGIVNTTKNIEHWGMNLTAYHDWFTGNALRILPYYKISNLDSFHDNKFSSFKACRRS